MFIKEEKGSSFVAPKKKHKQKGLFANLILEISIGIFSIIASFVSIYIATFMGVNGRSLFNASLLLLLTILLMVFLFVRVMSYFLDQRYELFVAGFTILLIDLVILVWKILEFISIPLT